jgi:hypothetical protein
MIVCVCLVRVAHFPANERACTSGFRTMEYLCVCLSACMCVCARALARSLDVHVFM